MTAQTRGRVPAPLAATVLSILLAGCGWRAVHGHSGGMTTVDARLAAVSVALMPERSGQLLRQALQARLAPEGPATPALELAAQYGVSREGVAILGDTSSSRTRLVAHADYSVRALEGDRATCLKGTVQRLEGVDIANQQLFAADLAMENAERRLAEAVADEIALRLSIALGQSGGACAP